MSTYRSNKYPSLLVKFSSREKVRFENGSAEVEGDLDGRLADFAKRHPEYEIERVGGEEPRETEKQRLQREARERGLSDAGKSADLKARIAEFDAQQGEGAGDADDEGDGEPEDDETDEDAGEGDSSEDDEN